MTYNMTDGHHFYIIYKENILKNDDKICGEHMTHAPPLNLRNEHVLFNPRLLQLFFVRYYYYTCVILTHYLFFLDKPRIETGVIATPASK